MGPRLGDDATGRRRALDLEGSVVSTGTDVGRLVKGWRTWLVILTDDREEAT